MVFVFMGQVAIPVVPTVRVVITFTKFVELQPIEQFYTPFSSPRQLHHGGRGGLSEEEHKSDTHYSSLPSSSSSSSSSMPSWLRRSSSQSVSTSKQQQQHHHNQQQQQQQRSCLGAQESDPFAIPSGYSWSSVDDKSRKMKKSKSTRKSKWDWFDYLCPKKMARTNLEWERNCNITCGVGCWVNLRVFNDLLDRESRYTV